MTTKFQPWTLKGRMLKERSKRLPLLAPIKSEQDIYEKYLKKSPQNSNALILGATPEPRDLAIKNGFKAYGVDISQDMLDKYTLLMQYKDHPNNIQKNTNWLTMDFKKSHFSIIMGDGSLNNLATKEQNEKLLSILKELLSDKGFLVLRQFVQPEIKSIAVKELVKLYRNKEMTFSDFFGELRLLIPMEKVYNKETFQLIADDAFDLIEKEYKKGLLNKEERDLIFAYKNKITNTAYPEKDFLELVDKKGFKLVEIFMNSEFRFANYGKMYVFQKK